jgi:hypothetical protein
VYKLSPLLAYDKHPLKSGIVLDLPFNEGGGIVTQDISKAHHRLAAGGAPVWSNLPSGAPVSILNGIGDYWDSPAAETADLDFTTGDYSLSCWIKPVVSAGAEMIIGRYATNIDGWELYLFDIGAGGHASLNLRHSHSSLNPDLSDSCYSEGWFEGSWYHLGVSRSGLWPVHYRNGQALTMAYEAGGVKSPDSANRDLVIGVRYTKNANYLGGQLKNVRAWNRALTALEWAELFELERDEAGI